MSVAVRITKYMMQESGFAACARQTRIREIAQSGSATNDTRHATAGCWRLQTPNGTKYVRRTNYRRVAVQEFSAENVNGNLM